MFKIILGTVPNPGITWFENPRRGRLIFLPHLSMKSNNGCKLKRQSFCYVASQLFNSFPADIRNFDGSMSALKAILDDFLKGIPDEPRLNGYSMYSRASSNSIASQINYRVSH